MAASLLGYMHDACALVAPCQLGASAASVHQDISETPHQRDKDGAGRPAIKPGRQAPAIVSSDRTTSSIALQIWQQCRTPSPTLRTLTRERSHVASWTWTPVRPATLYVGGGAAQIGVSGREYRDFRDIPQPGAQVVGQVADPRIDAASAATAARNSRRAFGRWGCAMGLLP